MLSQKKLSGNRKSYSLNIKKRALLIVLFLLTNKTLLNINYVFIYRERKRIFNPVCFSQKSLT